MSILTAADILTVRRKWIGDEVNLRREWGSAPRVTTGAVAGASSVALKALGTGTITRGTPFTIVSGGISQRYIVNADAAITSNTATVTLTGLLAQAIFADDVVAAESVRRSVYNKIYQKEMFSDVDIEDLAQQAEGRYMKRISQADEPGEMRFRAIKLFALREQVIQDSQYWQAWKQATGEDSTTARKQMLDDIAALEGQLSQDVHGFRTVEVYR